MQPNVICVSVDSLRADFCSFIYDQEQTTPFLSQLSESATVYESAITPSTWTLPVHTSVFTGLFPPEHGVLTGSEELGNHPTFAEQLQDSGYTNSAFYSNAWLDTAGILRGFDTASSSEQAAEGRLSDTIESISPRLRRGLGSLHHRYRKNQAREAVSLYRRWRSPETSLTGKGTDGEEDADAAAAELTDTDEPFCLFLHLDEAHWPYTPPNPHHTTFTDRSTPALVKNVVYWQNRVYGSRTNRLRTIAGDLTPLASEVETFRNLYRGGIRYCDSIVQKLVERLQSTGVWNDTVFILFGDHGDSFGEAGVFGHHFSTDDSLIHVPLLIRDPTDHLPTGCVSKPVSLVDIYPTVLRLAGVDVPDNSGIDLTQGERDAAFSYYDISNHDYYTNDYGVSKDDLPPPTQHTVWRSRSDRLTHFPIDDEYHVVGEHEAELRELLEEHISGFDVLETGTHELDTDVQQRLKAMGYLEE